MAEQLCPRLKYQIFFRDEFVAGMAETVLLPLLLLLPTAQPLIEKIWESESNTLFLNTPLDF